MKKVTIYFKSGNKVTFLCEDIEIMYKEKFSFTTNGACSHRLFGAIEQQVEAIKIHRPITQTIHLWLKSLIV